MQNGVLVRKIKHSFKNLCLSVQTDGHLQTKTVCSFVTETLVFKLQRDEIVGERVWFETAFSYI